MNRMSDLGLDFDLSPENEAKHYKMESWRPKFISDIDEMSIKMKTLQ
jgi:hypothetical protein